MRTQVTVMLRRLPTVADYKLVGLCSGIDAGIRADGDEIVNALMPQFNDKVRVELSNSCPAARDAGEPVIHLECDVEGFRGAWCLPASLFEIRSSGDMSLEEELQDLREFRDYVIRENENINLP